MALKLSTGLRNAMLGNRATLKGYKAGATLAYADNGASPDSITDSGNGLISSGFSPGDIIYTKAATTAGNIISAVTLLSVAAGTMTFATGTLAASEAFPAAGFVCSFKGGSLKDVFQDGVLRIYSGSQPTSPDSAVAGTLLMEITVSAGAFSAGAFTNGLEFGDAASGAISKASGETWQAVAAASGTAGWFRFVGNATDSGAGSTSLPRIDGSVGTSGADLNMSGTSITAGATYTIDTFTLTLPEYYGA